MVEGRNGLVMLQMVEVETVVMETVQLELV
jgi:hypothetical protein